MTAIIQCQLNHSTSRSRSEPALAVSYKETVLRISAELSLYPLQDDYKRSIKHYIALLEEIPELTVIQHALSTEIQGEYNVVFAAVEKATRAVFEHDPSHDQKDHNDRDSMQGVVLIAKYVNKVRVSEKDA